MRHPFMSRRRFLQSGTMFATAALVHSGSAQEVDGQEADATLDLHVHLFGTGDSGSRCRLSKTITEGLLFKLLAAKLRLSQRGDNLDEGYVLALAEHLKASGLSKAAILAQDAVYDRHGQPDWEKTHVYVPNDYLFEVVARYPQSMIPCVSINPQRADAIEELQRCASQGAKVLKIHPPIQGVDISGKEFAPFFRRCAELKVVVMVHTGHEHAAPIFGADLASPRKLVLALEEGCTVVACHCGTGGPIDKLDMLPDFLAMIQKYENLWGDTAFLGSADRARDMARLLAHDRAKERLLYGSDYPFPATPLAFAGTIGVREAARLQAVENPIAQDLGLKETLGIGRGSAQRGFRLICEQGGS